MLRHILGKLNTPLERFQAGGPLDGGGHSSNIPLDVRARQRVPDTRPPDNCTTSAENFCNGFKNFLRNMNCYCIPKEQIQAAYDDVQQTLSGPPVASRLSTSPEARQTFSAPTSNISNDEASRGKQASSSTIASRNEVSPVDLDSSKPQDQALPTSEASEFHRVNILPYPDSQKTSSQTEASESTATPIGIEPNIQLKWRLLGENSASTYTWVNTQIQQIRINAQVNFTFVGFQGVLKKVNKELKELAKHVTEKPNVQLDLYVTTLFEGKQSEQKIEIANENTEPLDKKTEFRTEYDKVFKDAHSCINCFNRLLEGFSNNAINKNKHLIVKFREIVIKETEHLIAEVEGRGALVKLLLDDDNIALCYPTLDLEQQCSSFITSIKSLKAKINELEVIQKYYSTSTIQTESDTQFSFIKWKMEQLDKNGKLRSAPRHVEGKLQLSSAKELIKQAFDYRIRSMEVLAGSISRTYRGLERKTEANIWSGIEEKCTNLIAYRQKSAKEAHIDICELAHAMIDLSHSIHSTAINNSLVNSYFNGIKDNTYVIARIAGIDDHEIDFRIKHASLESVEYQQSESATGDPEGTMYEPNPIDERQRYHHPLDQPIKLDQLEKLQINNQYQQRYNDLVQQANSSIKLIEEHLEKIREITKDETQKELSENSREAAIESYQKYIQDFEERQKTTNIKANNLRQTIKDLSTRGIDETAIEDGINELQDLVKDLKSYAKQFEQEQLLHVSISKREIVVWPNVRAEDNNEEDSNEENGTISEVPS